MQGPSLVGVAQRDSYDSFAKPLAMTLTGSIYDYETTLTYDLVLCLRCLSWPPQAADWPTRQKNYGWPDSVTVDRVVSNGCDVVLVAHRQCRQHKWMTKNQYRLSFHEQKLHC